MKTTQMIGLCLCASAVSGCMTMSDTYTSSYQSLSYQTSLPYQENYYVNLNDSYGGVRSSGQVTVPETYHVGQMHSPVSAKDKDYGWVSSQNPAGYTIEVADDAKASVVAKKLYQMPKTDRMAEIKYERSGKVYYKGLFGSYKNEEDAKKALNALPEEVKAGAGIKNWSSVQGNGG